MVTNVPSSREFPTPGNGYTIRQFLGSGAWKDAFRASSSHSISDRALLFFHKDVDSNDAIRDVTSLMRTRADHKWSGYLADVYGYHYSTTGQLFIAEELLARPLDRAGRIRDGVAFARIARDLSRGLVVIHSLSLVHRDLKLDNCGLDNYQRAKIFDLGSVTSEPGGVQGSILTRAPELLDACVANEPSRANAASDIWSLGAALYALRVGVYPFVSEVEARNRKMWNDRYRTGEITKEKRDFEKATIDSVIVSRMKARDAETQLHSRLRSEFRGSSLDTLKKMLSFDPKFRPNSSDVESLWSSQVSADSSGVVGRSVEFSDNANFLEFLRAAVDGEIEVTQRMKDLAASDFESRGQNFGESESGEIRGLLAKLKEIA